MSVPIVPGASVLGGSGSEVLGAGSSFLGADPFGKQEKDATVGDADCKQGDDQVADSEVSSILSTPDAPAKQHHGKTAPIKIIQQPKRKRRNKYEVEFNMARERLSDMMGAKKLRTAITAFNGLMRALREVRRAVRFEILDLLKDHLHGFVGHEHVLVTMSTISRGCPYEPKLVCARVYTPSYPLGHNIKNPVSELIVCGSGVRMSHLTPEAQHWWKSDKKRNELWKTITKAAVSQPLYLKMVSSYLNFMASLVESPVLVFLDQHARNLIKHGLPGYTSVDAFTYQDLSRILSEHGRCTEFDPRIMGLMPHAWEHQTSPLQQIACVLDKSRTPSHKEGLDQKHDPEPEPDEGGERDVEPGFTDAAPRTPSPRAQKAAKRQALRRQLEKTNQRIKEALDTLATEIYDAQDSD